MTVAAISSNLFNIQSTQAPTSLQKAQKEFQQLGTDLQAGNLTAAQSDFTTLQSLLPQNGSIANALSSSSTPIGQAFQQLGQDLKNGNLSGARQDFSNVRKDFKEHAEHVHLGGSDSDASTGVLGQLFNQLGAALQSGNLSDAQQAYNSITQQFQGTSISPQPVQGTIVPLAPVSVSI